ncbi:CoA transferase [Silicimonas algicola]|uniref:Benzylsuccinate CoA-transferase BbsF subunit n=1 Tax=Silicimonas algicola TaxID=1826607 RepID=A0A316G0V3_9RHOB|nr:CoA transferase [Silicimonas algicola]AZQ68334.1 CoA transferase [Silicimonas algicola]PWK53596.1 benzylsuccinate CoA-transferase BbsF subunit [Silicimonas algicola]
MEPLVLKGLRVIDFSWVMAGPMATKMLGALGAEIIKIESTTRPEFASRGGWFSVINNNKKSCTINIRTEEGQNAIRQLVAQSDVVVENFSSRVLKKYGLTFDDLKIINPRLIYVSASGVGRTGPQADYLAYGTLLQSYSGRVNLVGTPNRYLEAMGISPAWTDPITAFWEVFAILGALQHRRRTGTGSYIDLSMLESTVALLPETLLRTALGGPMMPAGGDAEIGSAPSGCYRCRGDDSWIAISVRSDDEWHALCGRMGRVDLVGEAANSDAARRWRNRASLNSAVAQWTLTQDTRKIERELQSVGVPASRSRSINDLLVDQHLKQRAVFTSLPGGQRTIALPWADRDMWRGNLTPSPELGGDNDYVFGELLGYDREERERLVEEGVIQ